MTDYKIVKNYNHRKTYLLKILFSMQWVFIQEEKFCKIVIMLSFEEQIVSESFMNSLSGFARKLTADYDQAEDLTQTTYRKILEKRNKFKGEYVLPWAITIMKNSYTDSYRKISEKQFIGEDEPEIPNEENHLDKLIDEEKSEDISNRVHLCFKKLENEGRELLNYRENGYSYEQISKMLDYSIQNLRVKFLRAKESMRLCLEGFTT